MAIKKDVTSLFEYDDEKCIDADPNGGEIDFSGLDPEKKYLFCFNGDEFKKFLTSGEKELRLKKAGWLQKKFDIDVFGSHKIVGYTKPELIREALEDDSESLDDFKVRWKEIYKTASPMKRLIAGI